VLAMTELLRAAQPGRPDVGAGSRLLFTTDDVLAGLRPPRLRQIGQKLLLTQGLRERVGLVISGITAHVQGYRRIDQR